MLRHFQQRRIIQDNKFLFSKNKPSIQLRVGGVSGISVSNAVGYSSSSSCPLLSPEITAVGTETEYTGHEDAIFFAVAVRRAFGKDKHLQEKERGWGRSTWGMAVIQLLPTHQVATRSINRLVHFLPCTARQASVWGKVSSLLTLMFILIDIVILLAIHNRSVISPW